MVVVVVVVEVVVDRVDLSGWVGRLVGFGVKLSVFVVAAFDHFAAVGLLLDRAVRRRAG